MKSLEIERQSPPGQPDNASPLSPLGAAENDISSLLDKLTNYLSEKDQETVSQAANFMVAKFVDAQVPPINGATPAWTRPLAFADSLAEHEYGAQPLQIALLYPIFALSDGREQTETAWENIKKDLTKTFGERVADGAHRLARFHEKIKRYNEKDQQLLLETAFYVIWKYIEADHPDRYSGVPAYFHPLRSAEILAELPRRVPVLALLIALVHDLQEDLKVTPEEIAQYFGPKVAEGMTKIGVVKKRPGDWLEERLRDATLRANLYITVKDLPEAALARFAERLDNLREIWYLFKEKPESARRTCRETLDIYVPLLYNLGMDEMAREMERLAFDVLATDQLKTLDVNFPAFDPEWRQQQVDSIRSLLGIHEDVLLTHHQPRFHHLLKLMEILGPGDSELIRSFLPYHLIIPVENSSYGWQMIGNISQDPNFELHSSSVEKLIKDLAVNPQAPLTITATYQNSDNCTTPTVFSFLTPNQQITEQASIIDALTDEPIEDERQQAGRRRLETVSKLLADVETIARQTERQWRLYRAQLEDMVANIILNYDGDVKLQPIPIIKGETALEAAAAALDTDVFYCREILQYNRPIPLDQEIRDFDSGLTIEMSNTLQITPWWLDYLSMADITLLEALRQTLKNIYDGQYISKHKRNSDKWREAMTYQEEIKKAAHKRGAQYMEFAFVRQANVDFILRVSDAFRTLPDLVEKYRDSDTFLEHVGLDAATAEEIKQVIQAQIDILPFLYTVKIEVSRGTDRAGLAQIWERILSQHDLNIVHSKMDQTNRRGQDNIIMYVVECLTTDSASPRRLLSDAELTQIVGKLTEAHLEMTGEDKPTIAVVGRLANRR